MMEVLITFLLAFFFSFIGSIPPGTLNITVIQLGLESKINTALRFSLAGALVEYPYAWLAIEFESLITSSPFITNNLHLIAAVVMISLGIFNLLPTGNSGKVVKGFKDSGFRRGLLLSIFNPLALPYWIGITAYLRSRGLITLTSGFEKHSYLVGVSLGAFCLLMLFAYLSKKLIKYIGDDSRLKRIPGMVLLTLGVYALVDYLV